MTDITDRIKEAMGSYEKLKGPFDLRFAKEALADDARTLLPEAIKEIEELRSRAEAAEAKANVMVADKINIRSELLSVEAKLAKAVEALEHEVKRSRRHLAASTLSTIAEIKGEKG